MEYIVGNLENHESESMTLTAPSVLLQNSFGPSAMQVRKGAAVWRENNSKVPSLSLPSVELH